MSALSSAGGRGSVRRDNLPDAGALSEIGQFYMDPSIEDGARRLSSIPKFPTGPTISRSLAELEFWTLPGRIERYCTSFPVFDFSRNQAMRKILAFVVIACLFVAPGSSDAGCCGGKLKLKMMVKPPLKKRLQCACPCLADLKLACKKK
jgi:hypothetical protein